MSLPPLLLVFMDPFPIRLLATFAVLKISSPMLATPRLSNSQMPNLSSVSASQQHCQSSHLTDHLSVSSFTSYPLVLALTLEYPRLLLESLVNTGCTSGEGELVWHCGFQCDLPENQKRVRVWPHLSWYFRAAGPRPGIITVAWIALSSPQ